MELTWERMRSFVGELRGLPPFARAVLYGAVVLALSLLLYLLVQAASGPPYEPVFTNLTPDQASQIAQALAAQKIPYQVSPDGTTVSVPENDAGTARLTVAAAGALPGSSAGFSLFDKPLYGNSDFQNQVLYVQALEGELQQTIQAMPEVAQARVSVVLPQEGLFQSNNTPATAAVFLQLKPFATLSPAQVAGIQSLVAHSVQGLSPGNVTVVDASGNILSSAQPSGGLTGNLAVQAAFDQQLSQSLVSLLTPVLGPGNVVAQVSADINFNQETVVSDLFSPPQKNGPLVKSLDQLRSTVTGSAQPPGTGSNIPTYGATGGGTSTSTHITQQNAINETQQTLRVAPGTIRRLTVSVIVNRQLTPAQQAALTQVVEAAIGYDPARHDQIIVQGLPFNTSLESAVAKATAAAVGAANLRNWILLGGLLAGLVLLLTLGMMLTRRLTARRTEPVAPPTPLGPGPEVSPEDRTMEELARLVRQNPDAAAEVVRGWLREE
jgi:flagellar M-ring protein FliF